MNRPETSERRRRLPSNLRIDVSKELSIRLLEMNDSQEFYDIVRENRENLREWLSWVDTIKSKEDIDQRGEACIRSNTEGRSLRFFITFNEAIVGMLAAKRIDWEQNLAELSYSLIPRFRGRKLASSSCRALMDFLSHDLGIRVFEIRIATGNSNSVRVADSLGFKIDRIEEKGELLHGQWIKHAIYTNKTFQTTCASARRLSMRPSSELGVGLRE